MLMFDPSVFYCRPASVKIENEEIIVTWCCVTGGSDDDDEEANG